jgi:hypothetical protein
MFASHILAARTGYAFAMLAGTMLAAAQPASATETVFYRPGELMKICGVAGGEFRPPVGDRQIYSCLLKDAPSIFCIGEGPDARTCSDTTPAGTDTSSTSVPPPPYAPASTASVGGIRGGSGKRIQIK